MARQIAGLSVPAETKITGRRTTIRGAFVKAIIPDIPFTPEEEQAWREQLQLESPPKCCYCGIRTATELDHFSAAISNKRPTGFVSDIYNLVPSCGKCNQSKGSKHWKLWMMSKAKNSPASMNIPDLEQRIRILDNYEQWIDEKRTIIPPEAYNGADFTGYLERCEALLDTFEAYQQEAELLKQQLQARFQR